MGDRVIPVPLHPTPEGLERLVARKLAAGLTVSVCLPARDEAPTIAQIVRSIGVLVRAGLVDEIVVCDDGSTDDTAALAAAAGARVIEPGSIDGHRGTGKGEALWTSLVASTGDLVCWVDADIRDFDVSFITRLLEPLIDDTADFVKGYYVRPFGDAPTGGGRVTELVARPLLSLLLPDLAGIVQPLSGEYAGRREVLEAVPFVQGWGVDIALLVDVARLVGADRVAQADLGIRRHKHRPLDELAPQAMAVLMAVLDRTGSADVPMEATLRRHADDHSPVEVPVSLAARPPASLVRRGIEPLRPPEPLVG